MDYSSKVFQISPVGGGGGGGTTYIAGDGIVITDDVISVRLATTEEIEALFE